MLFSQEIPEGAPVLFGTSEVENIYIPPPIPGTLSTTPGEIGNATIDLNFIDNNSSNPYYWSDYLAMKGAVEFAAQIWEDILTTKEPNVPIDINVTIGDYGYNPDAVLIAWAIPAGTAENFSSEDPAFKEDVIYPQALANKLAEQDLYTNLQDMNININVNPDIKYYTATDGSCPTDEYDLVTMILHEMLHGFGFFTSVQANNVFSNAQWGGVQPDGAVFPLIYDTFIRDSDGKKITELPVAASNEAYNYVTSDNLSWAGSSGYTNDTKIYSPSSWMPASSLVHIDSDASLMKPSIGLGEAIHNPGNEIVGMLSDMGWEVWYSNSLGDIESLPSSEENISEPNIPEVSYQNTPNCSSIDISFYASNSNSYVVLVKEEGESYHFPHPVPEGNYQYTLDNLDPSKDYSIIVKAINEYGDSESEPYIRPKCIYVQVYPNPSVISLDINSDNIIDHVEVRDIVDPSIGLNKAGDGSSSDLNVNIGNLPMGTYNVRVVDENGNMANKTIIKF